MRSAVPNTATLAGRVAQRAAIRHILRGPRLQAKLTIGAPNGKYEKEADRVADAVMRMAEPQLQRACACGGRCPECQAEQLDQEDKRLQTKRVTASNTRQIAAPPIVREALRSPGQPLDAATKAYFGPRFGHDFSKVRVHSDIRASEAAQAVSAKAFTVGQDIVFGTGQYDPKVSDGSRLLAHELTHVVQQQGDERGLVQRFAVCGTGATCPTRDPGELGRSRSTPMQVAIWDPTTFGVLISNFAINDLVPKSDLAGNVT